MLKYEELIGDVDEKYHAMLKEVDLVDFQKVMAQYSGINFNELESKYLKQMLVTWAHNKYRFYEMLGNKLRVDIPFEYEDIERNYEARWGEVAKKYPEYGGWAVEMKEFRSNKIESFTFSWAFRRMIEKITDGASIDGMKITRFFEKYLRASSKVVAAIASIYENTKISATYTISIDPIDMMLASENPYDWKSCYRLEHICDSHADGCAAAMVDTSSVITYIWNEEGKYKLYDTFELKNIRYKRMREWLSISPKMNAIHFNAVYPSKPSQNSDFCKSLRKIVEDIVANYKGTDSLWKLNERRWNSEEQKYEGCKIEMGRGYGYTEFYDNMIYKLKDAEDEYWDVYDTPVICLHCGCDMTGTYELDEDEYEYNGDGLVCYNIKERYGCWCDYCDNYCDITDYVCEESCSECPYWKDEHPVCDLDECECEDGCNGEIYDGVAHSSEEYCSNCPRWKECCEEQED